ncbi:T9SS type A sorting domain-containing protein [Flavobacterium buctense]|uniref:T9SS type A sorting domain-containing protein n=1 Tax=Flavobacterium buctense TaxID=1648146 RepID=A0ABU9E2B1_9FLAO|nr:T9SS type A sorting domain-containing protein [Flavobacterium buctense]
MKRILLLLSFVSLNAVSQTVSVLNIATNELVYSTHNGKIYASIPSANGSNGNSIGIINPTTISLENTVPIGSEPNVLAISSDGQTLYCGFNGTSSVRKFNVTNNTAGIQFPVGSDSFLGPFYAEDIEVMPDNPNTIAVARRNNGFSPKHEGVAVFDEGIMRTTTSQDHTGSNQIEFVNANLLVGFNNETTEFGFRKLTVNASGVTETSVVNSITWGFGLKFSSHNGKAYFTNGTVVDYNFSPFVSGTFTNANGPSVFDTNTNLVAFGTYDFNGTINFKRYNPETYLLTDNLPITQANGDVKSIITCGNGCYAFNTTDDKVVIIRYTLGTNDNHLAAQTQVYPNPTNGLLHIVIPDSFTLNNLTITNTLGQKIMTSYQNTVDVSSLSKGTYLITVETAYGNATKQFVKL